MSWLKKQELVRRQAMADEHAGKHFIDCGQPFLEQSAGKMSIAQVSVICILDLDCYYYMGTVQDCMHAGSRLEVGWSPPFLCIYLLLRFGSDTFKKCYKYCSRSTALARWLSPYRVCYFYG